MLLLTEDALVVCQHELGKVGIVPTQDLVRIDGRRVLVEPNPEGRPISGCPNVGATIKPCLQTLKVRTGYSEWIRIEGRPVCLDSMAGFTDGTPPGLVEYQVRNAGQPLVEELP